MTTSLPAKRFTVYAIRLTLDDLDSRRPFETNHSYVNGMECYYAGMTARDQKARYPLDFGGYKSNGFAKPIGVELMPRAYTAIKPRNNAQAYAFERRIAASRKRLACCATQLTVVRVLATADKVSSGVISGFRSQARKPDNRPL
jgi:hypothetical protein